MIQQSICCLENQTPNLFLRNYILSNPQKYVLLIHSRGCVHGWVHEPHVH